MKTIPALLRKAYRKAFRVSFWDAKEICGVLDRTAVDIDHPLNTDWTAKDTTSDQLRIETVLAGLDLSGKSILHVGVGNSRFAERFAARARRIDGITTNTSEKRRADSLNIPNYRTYLVSKHSRDLAPCLVDKYDFIVDNNLSSFACCKFHFLLMLDTYIWSLNLRGHIITEQKGMRWVLSQDPRWRLTYGNLVELEKVFPVKAHSMSDTVYSIQRCR